VINIKMKLPRNQINNIYYVGDADKFINLPIIVNERPIGTITKATDSEDDYYIDIEGYLWVVGVSYLKEGNELRPVDITIK